METNASGETAGASISEQHEAQPDVMQQVRGKVKEVVRIRVSAAMRSASKKPPYRDKSY